MENNKERKSNLSHVIATHKFFQKHLTSTSNNNSHRRLQMRRHPILTYRFYAILPSIFIAMIPQLTFANSCPTPETETYSMLDRTQQFDPWTKKSPLIISKKEGFLDPWGEPEPKPLPIKSIVKTKPIKATKKKPKKKIKKLTPRKSLAKKAPVKKKTVKPKVAIAKKTINKKMPKLAQKNKQTLAINKGATGHKGKALVIKHKKKGGYKKTPYKPVVLTSVFSNLRTTEKAPRQIIYYNEGKTHIIPTYLTTILKRYTPPIRNIKTIKAAKKANKKNTIVIDKHTTKVSLQKGRQGCTTSFMMFIEMFKTAQDTIMPSKYFILDKLADAMIRCPASHYIIETHSDPRGKADYNQKLSEQRAASIKKYLIAKDVKATQFKMEAYGESRPVNKGTNADDYASNRRVVVTPTKDIKALSKKKQ